MENTENIVKEKWFARLQKKIIANKFYPIQMGCSATLGEMDIYFHHPQYKNERVCDELHYKVEDANVLIIHGNLNRKFDPYLMDVYKRMKTPNFVIQLSSNILLHDYCQSRVLGKEIPIDLYIPGNPSSPTSIISAFEKLREQILGVSK